PDSYGDDPGYSNLTNYAWYLDNSGKTTHSVGQKLPNPWGLYDMHGNIFEWCQGLVRHLSRRDCPRPAGASAAGLTSVESHFGHVPRDARRLAQPRRGLSVGGP